MSPALLRAWREWLAPDPQPFLVESGDAATAIAPELRDTYCLWRVTPPVRVAWLSEDRFGALPRRERAARVRAQVRRRRGAVPTVRAWQDLLDPGVLRAQADGHRFVWWPSLVTDAVLARVVATDRLPSRHRQVEASTWRRCRAVLPGARRIAGTFSPSYPACCFSTVLDAAGADTTGSCDDVAVFDRWLRDACTPGGDDRLPGVVLAWRRHDGDLVHAAVTIGDGWALEKPSQEWHSPRAVVRVRDVVRTSRFAGQRLERWTIASE